VSWVESPESWWVRCLTETYSGLVVLMPFCYATMNYVPYYECLRPLEETPPGAVGCTFIDPWNGTHGSNDTNGTHIRTQDGELLVSQPRDSSWYDGSSSWWQACSITPADLQCATQARTSREDAAAQAAARGALAPEPEPASQPALESQPAP